MADFSPTQAAFEGFRLTRERPAAVAIWGVVLLLYTLATTGLLIVMAGPQLTEMTSAGREGTPDPAEMMRLFGAVGPAYFLIVLISLAVYAVLYAAVYRAVLRPGEGGPGFLRFGGDELRMALALVVLGLILFGAYLALAIVAGLAFGGAAVAGGGGPAGAIGGVVVVLALLSALVWLAVRLSLVLPATFDRRRLQIGPAWALTRGRFWPLLGAILLATVLMMVVYLLAMVVISGLVAAVGGGMSAVGRLFAPDLSSLSAYFTPATLLYVVFTAFLTALATAITVGVTAEAYRELAGGGESEVFA